MQNYTYLTCTYLKCAQTNHGGGLLSGDSPDILLTVSDSGNSCSCSASGVLQRLGVACWECLWRASCADRKECPSELVSQLRTSPILLIISILVLFSLRAVIGEPAGKLHGGHGCIVTDHVYMQGMSHS